MKKELLERAERYASSTQFPEEIYFTKKIPDCRFKGLKYFFLYRETDTVVGNFKTQKELDQFLTGKGF